MKKFLILLIALVFYPHFAEAQSQRNPCYYSGANASSSSGCIPVSSVNPLPISQQSSYTRITTNTNTVVKAAKGVFSGIVVNTAGATSSATVYDNTTCTGTVIGTFSTLAQVSLNVGANATTGICVTTAGGTPADITILWQ